MDPSPPTIEVATVLEFLFRLGRAYLACGEQTAQVELILRRVATAYGMRQVRVVTFPTAIFISLHDPDEEHVTIAEGPTDTLRLDQIADVYALGNAAQRAEIPPKEGLVRLGEILKKQPRFGLFGMLAGHAVLTVGLSIVLMPSLWNFAAAAVLGTLVGAIKALNHGRAVLALPLPVFAAAFVSTFVYLGVKFDLPIDPQSSLVPPLVTFLPGAMLSLGMIELAYGDMVSGSSRLITGFVKLVLLTFGLAAGAAVVGVNPDKLLDAYPAALNVAWMPWLGVLVFGIGVYFHFSAPRNSLLWLLLVLMLTFATQRASAALFGNEISGFFGMLVATPVGYLIQLKFKGPPAMVTFLPSFWLLVPGALGLLSAKRMMTDREAGIDGLITVIFAITSVALGTLVGASVYKFFSERFGSWQTQIGRVGSYFRDRKKV